MGKSSSVSPSTTRTVFHHHLRMNKLLLLAFLVTLMAVLTLGSESRQDEEVALARQVRGADAGKKGGKKGSGKKGRRQGGGRRKGGIKKKGGKKGKKGRKGKKGGKNGGKKGGHRQTTCTANATCLNNAMEYLNLMKGAVANYLKQDARIKRSNKTGSNKSGKKGLFGPTLRRIVKAGGGNKSDLQCAGSSNSSGAKQLKNLTDTLIKCESTINSSCNTANFPLPNMTEVSTCLMAMGTFKSMVDTCLKLNGTTACSCWVNSTFATTATTIRGCKISDTSKLVIKQLGYCKGNFSLCKTYEDEGLKAISACSESSADLTAKAAALTANSAGLTAAKTTASTLSSSRRVARAARATATTCAEVITKITALLKLVDENPASTKISKAAAEVTSVTVTCTTAEKTSLTSQVISLATAIVTTASELSTVQADLQTSTGSTASSAVISAAAASASSTAATAGRRNIVARHLMNRLNLN